VEGQRARLRDGRWLGYTDYGAGGGVPLFVLPGMPGSSLLAGHAKRPADEFGLRIIALDRPGIGLSDPKPGRTLRDTASDVADIADLLEFDQFFVMGISAGGPHALACALEMPERVLRVALVSSLASPAGVTPHRQEPTASQLGPRAREQAAVGGARRPPPGFMLREMERASPPSDRRILARPDVREQLLAAGEEAFRLGTQAVVDEGRLTAGAWGFRPADVTVEVLLWHGEQDLTVPVETARALAGTLPRCDAVFLPGAGHLWHFDHLGDVMSALRNGARARKG
jgi:pimeloyl-ACP methyl ester carboxylesterase